MAAPFFPTRLGHPSIANYTGEGPLADDTGEGNPRGQRRLTLERIQTVEVSWMLLGEDYEIFLTFWRDELLYGHRWFWLQLAGPRGVQWRLVQFRDRFSAVEVGFKAMRLSATLSLRQDFGEPEFTQFVSGLHPLMFEDALNITHGFVLGTVLAGYIESIEATHAFVLGQLREPLFDYTMVPEGMDVTHAFSSGVVTQPLKSYEEWPPEGMDVSHAFSSGVLDTVLLSYENWPAEAMDVSHAFVSGTLS